MVRVPSVRTVSPLNTLRRASTFSSGQSVRLANVLFFTCLPSLQVSLKSTVGRRPRLGTHSTCMTTIIRAIILFCQYIYAILHDYIWHINCYDLSMTMREQAVLRVELPAKTRPRRLREKSQPCVSSSAAFFAAFSGGKIDKLSFGNQKRGVIASIGLAAVA